MNVTVTYTLIICKEITVTVPDDSLNPTVDAVRLAQEASDVVKLRGAVMEVKDIRKEVNNDRNPTASTD